jgi:hypothetical protein
VPGPRLDGQRRAGERHRLVEAALLLADEGQQPGEPPVVAVRRYRTLDDRPRLFRQLGDTRERDRRHRGRQQQCVPRVRRQVLHQRPRVASDVADHGVHVAALPLGDPPGVERRIANPGLHVDLGAHLEAEQRQRGVAQGERRVVGDRGRERGECA